MVVVTVVVVVVMMPVGEVVVAVVVVVVVPSAVAAAVPIPPVLYLLTFGESSRRALVVLVVTTAPRLLRLAKAWNAVGEAVTVRQRLTMKDSGARCARRGCSAIFYWGWLRWGCAGCSRERAIFLFAMSVCIMRRIMTSRTPTCTRAEQPASQAGRQRAGLHARR